jgi:ribosome-associated translation inhibitor RaiA
MLVQINTDSNIEGRDELARRVEGRVRDALERFSDQLTRVEVHLGDENSNRKFGTDDKRCLLEARPAGLRPIAVSHQAGTMEQAVDGALDKFRRALDSAFGKLHRH